MPNPLVQARLSQSIYDAIIAHLPKDVTVNAWIRDRLTRIVTEEFGIDPRPNETILLSEVPKKHVDRLSMEFFDAILSGPLPKDVGVARRSSTILAGAPGVGKTSILLQSLDGVLEKNPDREVIYIGSEQLPDEFRDQAVRVGVKNLDRFRYLCAVGDPQKIEPLDSMIADHSPLVIVVDSLTSIVSNDGEAGVQMCRLLRERSRTHNIPTFIVAHVTRKGDVAGPLRMQNEVDAIVFMTRTDLTVTALTKGEKTIEIMCPEQNRYGVTGRFLTLSLGAKGVHEDDSKWTCSVT